MIRLCCNLANICFDDQLDIHLLLFQRGKTNIKSAKIVSFFKHSNSSFNNRLYITKPPHLELSEKKRYI